MISIANAATNNSSLLRCFSNQPGEKKYSSFGSEKTNGVLFLIK
jgi:hypothetical protein